MYVPEATRNLVRLFLRLALGLFDGMRLIGEIKESRVVRSADVFGYLSFCAPLEAENGGGSTR